MIPKLTPIRSLNEVLLLKAAKDLLAEWDRDKHWQNAYDLPDYVGRLRRAVELASGELE